MVKSEYWKVDDAQVIEQTGKPLDAFGAKTKKSNDVVAFLVKEHGVPRYWARTLTTNYLKS